jgi:hypothetical protein
MWFAWCGVAQCVDVRGRRCVGRSTSGSRGNRIADLACGCVRRPGKGAQLPCPLAPAREGSGALDRLARAGVSGSLGLEQRQHPLGAIGSPEGDTSAVFVAQGQLVHPHILPVLALPVAANHTSDGAGSPRCVHSGRSCSPGSLDAAGRRRAPATVGSGVGTRLRRVLLRRQAPQPWRSRPGATVVEADDPYADPYAGHPRTPRRPRALFPLVMPPRGGVERPGRVDALRAIDSTARSRSVDPTSLPRQGQPLRGCRR